MPGSTRQETSRRGDSFWCIRSRFGTWKKLKIAKQQNQPFPLICLCGIGRYGAESSGLFCPESSFVLPFAPSVDESTTLQKRGAFCQKQKQPLANRKTQFFCESPSLDNNTLKTLKSFWRCFFFSFCLHIRGPRQHYFAWLASQNKCVKTSHKRATPSSAATLSPTALARNTLFISSSAILSLSSEEISQQVRVRSPYLRRKA